MKKSGLLAASASAAAAASIPSTSTTNSSSKVRISLRKDDNLKKNDADCSKPAKASTSNSDKFAPRFDGLRFIETLVTAHR